MDKDRDHCRRSALFLYDPTPQELLRPTEGKSGIGQLGDKMHSY